MQTMYILKKDQNDILLLNEDDDSIRLLSEEEKEVVLEILHQLNKEETDSVRVDKLYDGLKVVIKIYVASSSDLCSERRRLRRFESTAFISAAS